MINFVMNVNIYLHRLELALYVDLASWFYHSVAKSRSPGSKKASKFWCFGCDFTTHRLISAFSRNATIGQQLPRLRPLVASFDIHERIWRGPILGRNHIPHTPWLLDHWHINHPWQNFSLSYECYPNFFRSAVSNIQRGLTLGRCPVNQNLCGGH